MHAELATVTLQKFRAAEGLAATTKGVTRALLTAKAFRGKDRMSEPQRQFEQGRLIGARHDARYTSSGFISEILRFVVPPALNFLAVFFVIACLIGGISSDNVRLQPADVECQKVIDGIRTTNEEDETEDSTETGERDSFEYSAWIQTRCIFAEIVTSLGKSGAEGDFTEVGKFINDFFGSISFIFSVASYGAIILIFVLHEAVKVLSVNPIISPRFDRQEYVEKNWTYKEKEALQFEFPGNQEIHESLTLLAGEISLKRNPSGAAIQRDILEKRAAFALDLHGYFTGFSRIALVGILFASLFGRSESVWLEINWRSGLLLFTLFTGHCFLYYFYRQRALHILNLDRDVLHQKCPETIIGLETTEFELGIERALAALTTKLREAVLGMFRPK